MAKSLNVQSDLTDGEARLIDVIAAQNTNQRSLARATGLSLGMTNLLIKRLVKKGLVKVSTMNGRTLSYILTPTGFAEKLRRSYSYLTASIRYISLVRDNIRGLVTNCSPETPIYILGSGELCALAEETLFEMDRVGILVSEIESLKSEQPGLCLLCEPTDELPRLAGFDIRTVV